jgi:micrococcal nuclease
MTRRCAVAGLLASLLVLGVHIATGHSAPRRIAATVVSVSDGDTIVVDIAQPPGGLQPRERVRLVNVDCPESRQAPWGPRATARLREMAQRAPVTIEVALQSRDRYGRLLAGVYLADGTLAQEHLVSEGLCDVLVIPPNVEYAERLRALKARAQHAGVGIWDPATGLGESPSEYRRRSRR